MEGIVFDTLTAVVAVSETIVLSILFYYYYVSVAGWRRHKEVKDFVPVKKFALVTAAHNEESVIQYHIESLKQLNYPPELFDIYIIADNCTDNTASVARREGVKVYERFSDQRGKGFALEWMFEQLYNMEDQSYDAICLFDADNVVSANFLLEMNSKLKQGARCIQGYLDTKNPNDSWVTACYATAYWSMNRMWQLARYNKGLSNALGGTGVCLEYKLLKEYGWGATCLTEDLEFTMKLMLNGIKTSWAHDAKVYDEKPVYFSQTWRQRTRWLQGHWDVCFRYMIPLVKKGIRERKWYPIDGAIYLFQPILILAMLLNFLLAGTAMLFPQNIFTAPISSLAPTWFWWTFGIIGYCYPMLGLVLEGAPRKAYFYYITYPFYGFTWFPVTVWGLLQHKKQGEWAHTMHHRGISIASLETGQIAAAVQPALVGSEPVVNKSTVVRRNYRPTVVTPEVSSSINEAPVMLATKGKYSSAAVKNQAAAVKNQAAAVKNQAVAAIVNSVEVEQRTPAAAAGGDNH